MRSSIHGPEYLFMRTMKKKPRLKEIFDRLDDMSEDDINNLNESKWIRDALITIKQKGIKTEDDANITKRIMKNVKFDILGNPDELFYVRVWNSSDGEIPCESFGPNVIASEIDIAHGEPILISPLDRVIMFGSMKITLPSNKWVWLIQNTKCLGKMTRQQYHELYNEYISKKL